MKKMLVTGGCGFLGAAFIRHQLQDPRDVDVVNYDSLTYASMPERLAHLATEPYYQFVKGDVADDTALGTMFKRAGPFDVVVHFAAETHVDRSLVNAIPFVRSNVLGTQVLLDEFRKQQHGKFIHISTDEIYGPAAEGVHYKEDATLHPKNPYSATKAAADHLVEAAVRSYGIDACIVRSVNVYGPSQYPEKFIPLAVTTLLGGGQIPLYGDGAQVRDWVYVDDYVRAVEVVIASGYSGEVYHVSSQDERTNRQVAESICALCDVPVADGITRVDDRPGHDRRYGLDAAKLRAMGWTRQVDFVQGLRQTVDYFRQHPKRPAPARPNED
jgi:dTDP-glucose 4,6-dehydratase